MKDYDHILFGQDGGVATLTLNRPQVLNAIHAGVLNEIEDVLEAVEKSDSIRCLILTGAGRAFCPGWDISAMGEGERRSPRNVADDMQGITKLAYRLWRMPKPVIAAVNGIAAGGGASLALASDLVVMTEGAKLAFSFINVGFVPDIGLMYSLTRLVGLAKAKELTMLGRTLDASEASSLGLVNRVVPGPDCLNVAKGLGAEISRKSPLAIQLTKFGLNQASTSSLSSVLDFELAAQTVLSQSEEHLESVRGFLSGRQKG